MSTQTRYRIFKGRPEWRLTDPVRPWKVLEQRQGDEEPSCIAQCDSWEGAIATVDVAAARAEHHGTFSVETDAAVGREEARRRLFAAMMRRFEARLAARKAAGANGWMSFDELYELGLPCVNCTLPLGPLNAHSHEIVMESGRTPYARCSAR